MTRLCPVDELVLMMVASSDKRTTGIEITNRLEKQFKHAVGLATVLGVLKKLERKGVITSRFGKVTTKRSKNRERLYSSPKNLDTIIVEVEQIWYTELGGYIEQILEHSYDKK